MRKKKKTETEEVVQEAAPLNKMSQNEYIAFSVWNAMNSTTPTDEEKEVLNNVYTQFKSKEVRAAEMLNVLENYMKIWKEREEQEEMANKNKFKFGGHIADQILHYKKPGQLSLFDQLTNHELKKQITKEETFIEGIKLSVVEDRLLNGIFKIIDSQLQTQALKYQGDTPILDIPLYDLYEAYELQKIKKSRQEDYSGGDIETVKNALYSLEGRRFLIRYVRREIDKKGEGSSTLIERYETLIKVEKIYLDLTDQETEEHIYGNKTNDRKGKIIIALNPILLDQIDTKCILLPKDINTQIQIANGGKQRVSECVPILIKYLLRQIPISKKRKEDYHVINYDNLVYMLGLEKELKEGRRKRIENRIQEAISIAMKMNIITDLKQETGVLEQRKYLMKLNYDY